MKTHEQVEELKAQWSADPCWDIEDTPGYEPYRYELRMYRKAEENRWRQEERQRLLDFAAAIGLADNLVLAEHMLKMEREMTAMAEEIHDLKETLAYQRHDLHSPRGL